MKLKMNSYLLVLCTLVCFSCKTQTAVQWVTTTECSPWESQTSILPADNPGKAEVTIKSSNTRQTIEGFGACFSELGWTSLNVLDAQVREDIMKELFSPGVGANFTICRMPIAANDFALDWYSYNETENDFEMKNFSIENDKKTLIPFIKKAQQYYPDLKIWASPWCPPTWMKYNRHYACSGLPAEQQGAEGTDMFIRKEPYLKAYTLYFSKFIDAYRDQNIDVFGVMPQNEFNSCQVFPSCTWTAAGLAEFVGKYLGPAMEEKKVELMFGTMERANEALVDTILTDPACSKYVTGVGFQWAGKGSLPGINKRYPNMKLYQTEQECGDGQNNWKGAMHSWGLMKHYLSNGVSVYDYWNISLMQGGVSRWGWAQNSLVVVNEDKTFQYTPEYYVMKHVSHYVMPGAKNIATEGAYEDVLAFLNPDKTIVIIAGNENDTDKTLHLDVNGKMYAPTLKANSLNTFIVE